MKIEVMPVGVVYAAKVHDVLNGVAYGCTKGHPIHPMLEDGWKIHSIVSHRDDALNCTTIAAVLVKQDEKKPELSGGPEDPTGD